jgi:preprotein translocase subunit SecF
LERHRTSPLGPGSRAKALGRDTSSVAMLVYIWIRLEWPFAVGAIVALMLDLT